jgi:flagellar biosynthesis regulator FlbT
MPLSVSIKKDTPFYLNGARIMLPKDKMMGCLGVLSPIEFTYSDRTVVLRPGTDRAILVNVPPREQVQVNGALVRVSGRNIVLLNGGSLITGQHRVDGLPPGSPAERLYKTILAIALQPPAGPLADKAVDDRLRDDYRSALSAFRVDTLNDQFIDRVESLVANGNYHSGLIAFRTLCPSKLPVDQDCRVS